MIKYWIEKSIVENRIDRMKGDRALGKVLWSPQESKNGRDIYKNMREVNAGDIILHLIDNKIFSGISLVKSKAVETSSVEGTPWNRASYLVELEDYIKLDPPIKREDILNQNNKEVLSNISKTSEVFYNSYLGLRQGAYLTPCPRDLLLLIAQIFKDSTSKDLPHSERMDITENINNLNALEKEDSFTGGVDNQPFNISQFATDLKDSGLIYSEKLLVRFVASLLTKPFLILTGLSGSGKTKLAQSFAQWICENEDQYKIIPVGADWTNREPLLGFPNALEPGKYVKPDSGALDLIINAKEKPELPFFLILDEMNLSIVERYFADFLSVMESNEFIPMYSTNSIYDGVPAQLYLPSNLFIIGTVNIDETTNMFSPKVLDRANTIEFRVDEDEMKSFLVKTKDINLDKLISKGAAMANSFLEMSNKRIFELDEIGEVNSELVKFFGELKKIGAEFGYRTASEILRLINQLNEVDGSLTLNEKIDIAIIQKLLPKLHGSRRKLSSPLETLGRFCISAEINVVKDVFDNSSFDFKNSNVKYPLSLEKIDRMYRSAFDNGFASFAEA